MIYSNERVSTREASATNDMAHFSKRSKRYGLQAHMTRYYANVTGIAALLLVGLYALFLAGEIQYALSHGVGSAQASSLAGYPWACALVMALLILPCAILGGKWFGRLTTRKLVQRVHNLVTATAQIANGNYAHRVSISGNDEIGQLEYQFNRMAEQLAETIAQRQALAEENKQLAEKARLADLTPREMEVLALVARGRSNHEIATELVISEPTVRTHMSNILTKLHLADRTQAAIYALQHYLVPLDIALE